LRARQWRAISAVEKRARFLEGLVLAAPHPGSGWVVPVAGKVGEMARTFALEVENWVTLRSEGGDLTDDTHVNDLDLVLALGEGKTCEPIAPVVLFCSLQRDRVAWAARRWKQGWVRIALLSFWY